MCHYRSQWTCCTVFPLCTHTGGSFGAIAMKMPPSLLSVDDFGCATRLPAPSLSCSWPTCYVFRGRRALHLQEISVVPLSLPNSSCVLCSHESLIYDAPAICAHTALHRILRDCGRRSRFSSTPPELESWLFSILSRRVLFVSWSCTNTSPKACTLARSSKPCCSSTSHIETRPKEIRE